LITTYYEVVSKIFRDGAAIYATIVLVRSTDPNRPFSTAKFGGDFVKRAKTSPLTLARTNLADSP
jgi:hypothetical protein